MWNCYFVERTEDMGQEPVPHTGQKGTSSLILETDHSLVITTFSWRDDQSKALYYMSCVHKNNEVQKSEDTSQYTSVFHLSQI